MIPLIMGCSSGSVGKIPPAFTLRSAPSATLNGVTWSPTLGKFCIAGSSSFLSSDGFSWTAHGLPDGAGLHNVAWSTSLGKFCGIAFPGFAYPMVSSDGISWTKSASSLGAWALSPTPDVLPANSAGRVLISRYGERYVWVSTDGINYTQTDVFDYVRRVAWSPELGTFAATTQNISNASFYGVVTSPTGQGTWTSRTTPNSTTKGPIAWSPGRGEFLVGGSPGLKSNDAVNWVNGPDASWAFKLYWIPERNYYIALRIESDPAQTGVWFSPDGFSWARGAMALNTDDRIMDIAWSPSLQRLCAIGTNITSNAAILYTADWPA